MCPLRLKGKKSKKTELLQAIVILPGTALVYIPLSILYFTRSFTWLGGVAYPLNMFVLFAGILFLGAGLFIASFCVRIFFDTGNGTPAPWSPPRCFVVRGPYCYVRNPMILGVLLVLLGEAVLLGSWGIFAWFVLFWLINTVYFIRYEEPALIKRFGAEYLEYTENVRRWLPRRTPWNPSWHVR